MYKLTCLALVLLWLGAAPALAQDTTWSKTYGCPGLAANGHSVHQTADKGYMVMGSTCFLGEGGWDVYVVKTDSLGNTLWSRTYGESGSDHGRSAQKTYDGGYVIGGWTDSFGSAGEDACLIKTDSSGDTLWSRTYGGGDHDRSLCVRQTPSDSGYILVGQTWSFADGGSDVYLIKTDSLGDTLWSQAYGGGYDDCGFCVDPTADGGYVIAGSRGTCVEGWSDIYLIKTDPDGDTVWTRTYSGDHDDRAWAVRQTNDSGYIVVGATWASATSSHELLLLKIDDSGDTLWCRTYGGDSDDFGYSVEQTSDSGFIVTGWSESFGNDSRYVYVVKTDALGDTLWSRITGGSCKVDVGYSIVQTTEGGYMVGGSAASFSGGADMILVKLDASGNTCRGEFVSPDVSSVSLSAAYPTTVVSPCSTVVGHPNWIVGQPTTTPWIACPVLRGDANGDEVIGLGDVVYIQNYLYKSGPAPDPLETGDATCDGIVSLDDMVFLLNYLYKQGPSPCC